MTHPPVKKLPLRTTATLHTPNPSFQTLIRTSFELRRRGLITVARIGKGISTRLRPPSLSALLRSQELIVTFLNKRTIRRWPSFLSVLKRGRPGSPHRLPDQTTRRTLHLPHPQYTQSSHQKRLGDQHHVSESKATHNHSS